MLTTNATKAPQKRGLVRSVAILASGTAFSQIILLAASPILTRLYTPDQFGLLAAYMAVVTIAGAISTLRYELVIPLPRRDSLAVNALALTIGSVLIVSLVAFVMVAVAGPQLAHLLGLDQLAPFAILVPFGILSLGIYTALNNWAVRSRSFGTITRTKLTQSLGQTAIQISAAFTPVATAGLLFGNLLGQSAGISSFVREFLRDYGKTLRQLSWKRMWFLARHYRQFPMLSLPASVAFSASQQAPSLIMMAMFGPATAGFYLLAQRVGMMPANLLGTAMSQSVYRNLAEQRKDVAKMGQAVAQPVTVVSKLIIGPAIFMAVIAPQLIAIAFGHDWEPAGHYLRWMAPWVATTIIFGAMSPVVSILGLQVAGLVFQVTSLLVSALAMYAAGSTWGPVAAIAAFSIAKSMTIMVYRFQMLSHMQVRIGAIALSIFLQITIFSAIFGALLVAITSDFLSFNDKAVAGLVLVMSAAAVYFAINVKHLRKSIQRRRH